ncbi:hypothetical protein H6F96_19555 [Microcoleus sp. FACHB-53]|nr:hypothetical protein [Microcoleus sp. FACHB-53]
MAANSDLPSYEEIFGRLDFKKGDDGRSVLSPAAYLVDLLQLLDDNLPMRNLSKVKGLHQRRGDIKNILLNTDNAFTWIPYLDIVNDILGQKVGSDTYATLQKQQYPFNLPFNFENERIKKFLHYLNVSSEELYKLFSLEFDPVLIGREYLKLSIEEFEAIIQSPTTTDLKAYSKITKSSERAKPANLQVANFLAATRLSGVELRELLYQNLSETAKEPNQSTTNSTIKNERVKATDFFINYGLGGYAVLHDKEESIVWNTGDTKPVSIPDAWFDRTQRVIRLQRKIGLSFTELDLILRTCCQHASGQSDLDGQVIQKMAVIKQLCDRYEIAADVACSFFRPMNVLGIGDGLEPEDLFNRVFNGKFAHPDKKYIRGSAFAPASYANYATLPYPDDILSSNGKEYRKRVSQALGMSDAQLVMIVNKFRDHAKQVGVKPSLFDEKVAIDLPALSLLFRLSQLVEILELSYEDLFNLFDILEKDPIIRTFSHFNILIPTAPQEQDCYLIIAGNDAAASMWLVQMLGAIAQWLQTNDVSAGELKQWLTGAYKDEAEATASRQQRIDFLNSLYQQFKPLMFSADTFASEAESGAEEIEAIDRRTARIIYQTFIEKDSGLVASQDNRLVKYDTRLTEKAIYQALTQLERFNPEDFTGLGLESKVLDKIFNNLILKDYISPEGLLLEEQFPTTAEQFELETDFSAYRDEVFTIIHDLLMEAMEVEDAEAKGGMDDAEFDENEIDESESDDEMSVGMDDTEDDEDEDDETEDDEMGEMSLSLSLAARSPNLTVELAIYPSDLEVLTDLSEKNRNELYDNLIFNGYIDEEGNVLQTDFLADQDNVEDFELNTDIANYARQIFNLILGQIQQFHQAELALDREVFADLPLKPFEIDNLMENLVFNEYINFNHLILNKDALLTTTPETFNLALAFYPHRRRILKNIQRFIREFKSDFYTLSRDLFAHIADEIAARQVYQHLEPDYLRNGLLKGRMLEDETEGFFLDVDNFPKFVLGAPFSSNDTEIIFGAIQTMVRTAKKYQFTPQVLEELDFDLDEQEKLIDILESTGYLRDRTYLTWEKVSYFLRIDNALEFTLTGFEDYNKDIFFALHEVAKVIDADVQAIAAQFKTLAESQSSVLLEALQDHFGVDADIIQTLCQRVLQNTVSIAEEFLVPILAVVNSQDVIAVEPDNNTFNFAYRRIWQFAAIAAKLGLNQIETEIVWQDQDLVEKFPEKLALPPGVDRMDALLETQLADGKGVIYLFTGNQYWRYSAENYKLLPPEGQPLAPPKAQPLTTLSVLFAEITKVNAAFTAPSVGLVLIAQGITYRKAKGSDRWVQLGAQQPGPQLSQLGAQSAKIWGKVSNNFEDLQRVEATFQDRDGRTYLFSGNQYIRYSSDDYSTVDEGYPLRIKQHWRQDALCSKSVDEESSTTETKNDLPKAFQTSIDASFQDVNGKTYLFKDKYYFCLESSEPETLINQTWGKVRNNFETLGKIDAAYADGNQVFIFSDDQVIAYQDSLENAQILIQEGFPKRLRNQYPKLPPEFVDGVEAAFKGQDGSLYLFKGGTVLKYSSDLETSTESPVKESWGRVRNTFTSPKGGRVDAAFVGLDGKTYLFSKDQYVRYSGADYTKVDDGFPRTIDQDWGGLNRVQDAFILDGKTYLFGTQSGKKNTVYVRYSTHDYTKLDEGYPKPPNDNWWNLPLSLVEEGADFETIDAVFNAPDDKIYLFSGDKFIYFDQQQRWWSEPQKLAKTWSLPFKTERVSAAFTGKDGKTYVFSGTQFIKYSGQDYSRADDRYPNITNRYWGYTTNNIVRTGRVDAVLVVESHEKNAAGQEQATVHTYLFSGNQYFRYRGSDYTEVEEGYPKTIATSLQLEPRFKNLDSSTLASIQDGIDAAFADRRQIYLFKGSQCYVVSETLYKDYGNLGLTGVSCAFVEKGTIFLDDAEGWQHHSSLEGLATHKIPLLPPCLRQVPDAFQTGINAVLQGRDRNTYLFKGSNCFNVSLNRFYPLSEEWGRVKNNIDIQNTVEAAFVGTDGKTYLFSGDQFVVYAADSLVNKKYVYGNIEQLPRSIKDHWGGLTRVSLAFVKDEKTYLFEPADAQGNARYVCYSTTDYSQSDAGFPKVSEGDRSFWQIPADYVDEEFKTINAVLFEGENIFLISGKRYIQYDVDPGQWTYPKPLARIWRDIPFNNDTFKRIKTAFTGRDGNTYFFAEDHYVICENQQFQPPAPINQRWGKVRNNFTDHPQGNRVDAAFIFQGQTTYLFSGDQYVRYSGSNYRYVDEGYPKTIATNLLTEAGFQNLPEAFEDILTMRGNDGGRVISAVLASDRTLYLLVGDRWHAVSQSLTATYPLSRFGHLKNNIVQHNKVDAALFQEPSGQTFLFSGDQGVRYSDDTYTFVDDGYPKSLATILTQELGLTSLPDTFQYGIDAVLKGGDGRLYVFKGKEYLRSDQATSQLIAAFWGKVNNNFVSSDRTDPSRVLLDAAFIAPNGNLYAFKGDQYIRYSNLEQEYVDEGFPKLIQDNWGNLPVEFEASISGGFVFEGKTYLLKDNDYVRYSNSTYQLIDTICPQKVKYRWGDWSDYLLNDLYIITRFKQLQDGYSSGGHSLLDLLHPETDPVADPYAMLAELFKWDMDEVKWLKRKNAFLRDDTLFEIQFKLEIIIRLFDIFAIAQKIGASPSELYEGVWRKRYEPDTLKEYELNLIADSTGKTLPETGKRLIAIAQNDQTGLHFRIFDRRENKVVDLREVELKGSRSKELESLKAQLQPYWNSNASSIPPANKESIVDAVISITGYSPLKDAADTLYRFLALIHRA